MSRYIVICTITRSCNPNWSLWILLSVQSCLNPTHTHTLCYKHLEVTFDVRGILGLDHLSHPFPQLPYVADCDWLLIILICIHYFLSNPHNLPHQSFSTKLYGPRFFFFFWWCQLVTQNINWCVFWLDSISLHSSLISRNNKIDHVLVILNSSFNFSEIF